MKNNKLKIAALIVLIVIVSCISGAESSYFRIIEYNPMVSALIRTAGGILEGLLVFLVGRNLNREKAGKVVKIIGCVMMITSVIGGTVMLIAGGRI